MSSASRPKASRPDIPSPTALRPGASPHNPFMLPVCDCGGPMNLASLEPHPTLQDHELKTFKCARCGTQHVFNVQKRASVKPE